MKTNIFVPPPQKIMTTASRATTNSKKKMALIARHPVKSDNKDDDRTFSALVIPWIAIALASIAAAGFFWEPSAPSLLFDTDFEAADRSLYSNDDDHQNVYEEVHDPLLPLTSSDKIGFACAIVGLLLAAGGGIGGGGMLVPIYILVMGFSPKHAIPLSNITVFGGSLANMILNTQKRHPFADRPLVDWDLILVMEPLTIGGALVGAVLNKLLPELFLVFMLVVLLTFTAYNTLRKAMKMYDKETVKLRQEEMAKASDNLLKESDVQDGQAATTNGTGAEAGAGAQQPERQGVDTGPADELQRILDEERVAPKWNIIILVVMFVVVLAVNLTKGGGAFQSPLGITCGSNAFWVANALMLAWILSIGLYVRSYLLDRFHLKEQVGYKYLEGDIEWDDRATIVYPCICCIAGFFAGMFGVGGGIVKAPLMLAMGVHPEVASASSACMILFTSFTATTSFIVFGLLDRQYAPVCFCIGFIATYFGQIGLSILMKRAKRNSYIAFSIGGVVLLSALLMSLQSFLSIAEGEHHTSGGVCGIDS